MLPFTLHVLYESLVHVLRSLLRFTKNFTLTLTFSRHGITQLWHMSFSTSFFAVWYCATQEIRLQLSFSCTQTFSSKFYTSLSPSYIFSRLTVYTLPFSAIKLNETKATYFSIPFEKLLPEGFQFEIYIADVVTKPQLFSISLSLFIIIELNEVSFRSVCNYETLANLWFKIWR